MIIFYLRADDASSLEALDASWAQELSELAPAVRRSHRLLPVPPFPLAPLDAPAGPEALAVRMIQRIQEASNWLRTQNAVLRSMCPDCRHDGQRCPRSTGSVRDDTDLAHSSVHFLAEMLLILAGSCGPTIAPVTREALAAALVARNDAIEGRHTAVDEFSRTWLGISRPERWREAVEMALLGDWVDRLGRGTLDDPALLELLRRHTHIEHRHMRPLWERKTRGRRTALLGEPVGPALTVQDLLVEHRTPETEVLHAELDDSRLLAVLRALDTTEDATARRWADDGDSWGQAALAAGLPAAYGERVRRKLKRLGARRAARVAAAQAGGR
jgi:hypothetical protein